ncbi:hypothetical protein B7463_g3260, partial [Scytalidium lignicola]
MSSSRTALVFGASGITGWAIAKEALRYPSPTTFDQVIALTNRPLSKIDSLLPEDERLQLYSGIDLSAGASEVEKQLANIDGINNVTNVYFAAFILTGHVGGTEGIKANLDIIQNAVEAVEKLSPRLESWTLQTGGMSYGFMFVRELGLPTPPLKESNPRIPEPFASQILYYSQYDLLKKLSKGKSWKFVEVRPDGVSGFVPSSNAMNMAHSLGIFFSFYASIEGRGASVPYPGSQTAFVARHTDVSQSILAHFHIYTSLYPGLANGDTFNIGDEDSISWEEMWPTLTSYFGLVGRGPDEGFNIDSYIQSHKAEWLAWIEKNRLKRQAVEKTNFSHLTVMMSLAAFDRQYDITKAREIGFIETEKTVNGYLTAFELMKEGKIIP